MKRFWLVLLSLGLVMAFSASVFAVDVKVSGSYYIGGLYLDRTNLDNTADKGTSTAFYYQRLRVKTEFVLSPGLSLITRADIMERILGGARTAPGGTADTSSSGTRAENENIAFDLAYMQYASPVGIFLLGYIPFGNYGTIFGNTDTALPGGQYILPIGSNMKVGGYIFKVTDGSYTANNLAVKSSDTDFDTYLAFAIYSQKNLEVGLAVGFERNATARTLSNYILQAYIVNPYFSATFGPLRAEGELAYAIGKARQYDNGIAADVDENVFNVYLNAVATFAPVYVGGTFAYASGTDPNSLTSKRTDILLTGGTEWSPALIMWNRDRAYTVGNLTGANPAAVFGAAMVNAYFYQLKGGVRPTDKLDICVAVSKTDADQNPVAGPWVSKDMGWEVDLTGTYKLTNNLSYMLGFGYLFTGDYFKGASAANKVANDYLIINKLALTF